MSISLNSIQNITGIYENLIIFDDNIRASNTQ